MTDWSLLRQYLDTGSQAAFSTLMDRRMKMVYWTCRRDLKDDQLAEDATQAVFVLLVQKARLFNKSVSISSWLFQAARFVSRDTIRREGTRKRYEEEAAQTMAYQGQEEHWPRVERRLNDAIATLSAGDQETILLRFFEDLSLSEVAEEIGTSEDAARKRVARAVERMRRYLTRKEVAVSSAALAALLASHPAKAVPAGAQSAAHAAVGQALAGHVPTHLSSLLLKKGAYLIMQTTKAKIMAAIAVAAVGLLIVGVAGFKAYRAHTVASGVEFTDLTAASLPANDPAYQDRKAVTDQLRRIIEGFDRHDISPLKSTLAPNGTFDQRPNAQLGSTAQNLDALQQSLATHPDMRVTASLISADMQGDRATIQMLSDSTTTTVPGDGEVVGKHIESRQKEIQHWVKLAGRWRLMDWYVE